MIFISGFIKICLAIRKLIGGIHRLHGERISLLLFLQKEESRLKMKYLQSSAWRYILCIT
jgi:hypothetical protein